VADRKDPLERRFADAVNDADGILSALESLRIVSLPRSNKPARAVARRASARRRE